MKKRIGILTFHCAYNYGAVLQTYGLQEQLKLMNFDVEIIDYKPPFLVKPYRAIRPFKTARTCFLTKFLAYVRFMVKELTYVPLKLRIRNRFADFITSKLQLSKESYYQYFEENLQYDFYVIGSDQIWNPEISEGFDPIYFGKFRVGVDAKKITYAASMSKYDLTDEQKVELRSLLTDFDGISARENELSIYLSDNFQIKTTTVLDPTLLVTPDVWQSMAETPRKKRYLLVYTIGLRRKTMDIAHKIAMERGLEIIEIVADDFFLRDYYRSNAIVCASPQEFVGWFKNAELVVTSSFHGTAFSIIFNKQFWVIGAGNGRDSRIRTLLTNLGLESRLILCDDSIVHNAIDYTEPNKHLQVLRTDSVNFLKKNLL